MVLACKRNVINTQPGTFMHRYTYNKTIALKNSFWKLLENICSLKWFMNDT